MTVNVPPTDPPDQPRQSLFWRRLDQAAIGGLVLLALLMLGGWWLTQVALRGRLIEFERAPRQEARFAVDVNRADWPELAELPGVGETLARRIVESRTSAGPFVDHEDLRRVKGIGPRTLERIRPHLLPLPNAQNVAGP